MSEGNQRWTVPTHRFGASVVIGIVGTFVVCGSFGMDNLTVAAIGIALIAVALGLYVISAINGRNFAYTRGTAHVRAVSEPPQSATRGRCSLDVMVSAQDLPSTSVKFRDPAVPLAKWPDVGSDLPVLVNVFNPRQIKVLWDEVRPHGAPDPAAERVLRPVNDPDDPRGYDPYAHTEIDDVTIIRSGRNGGSATATVTRPVAVVAQAVITEPVVVAGGASLVGTSSATAQTVEVAVEVAVAEAVVAESAPAEVAVAVAAAAAAEAVVDDAVAGPVVADHVVVETVDVGPVIAEPSVVELVVGEPTLTSPMFSASVIVDAEIVDSVVVTPRVIPPMREPTVLESMIVEPVVATGAEPVVLEPAIDDVIDGASERGMETDDDPFESAAIGVTETGGRRTIELDVGDPKLLRWSPAETEPVSPQGTPTRAASESETAAQTESEPAARAETAARADAATSAETATLAETATRAEAATRAESGTETRTEAATETQDGIQAKDEAEADALPRRMPSPRPRMGKAVPFTTVGVPAATTPLPDDIVGLSFGSGVAQFAAIDDQPTIPLRFNQARVVTPAVTADDDTNSDELFDQAASNSDAYLAAAPPPGGATVPGRIRSVAVTLFVSDLSRSIIFYRDQLGFTESDAGRGSAVLISGAARIVLRRVAMPPVERRLVQLLLEVPDVDAAYADLRSRGVSFLHRPRPVGQYEQLTLWGAAFRDPDGHGIAVTQWRDA